MPLPVSLPIAPMLAKSVETVPGADAIEGGYAFEPKWDGFRCIVSRIGDTIRLDSRSKKPLTDYFPEVVSHAKANLPDQCVMDAELVIRSGAPGGEHLDWDALSQRIHPAASRIARLSVETPAELIFFDLLALGDRDLMGLSLDERRMALETLFAGIEHPSLHLTAQTLDTDTARDWFTSFEGAGLDGVIAKPRLDVYRPGARAMLKIKHHRTAEAVVVGYRVHKRGHGVGSLLLGMYDASGQLNMMGGIGALSDVMRDHLETELQPLVVQDADGLPVAASKARSRFSSSKDAEFVPLRPELVVEVAFDQLEGHRFRHAVTLLRFRPDRDPQSCLIDQVDRAASYDLARVLAE